MIHYHGTPITPDEAAVKILKGRHAMISFANPKQIGLIADICQSFVLDNGAFSMWKTGKPLDVSGYYRWVDDWRCHPGFDWALIPDVIEGTEEENDRLLGEWPFKTGVPIWHLHESLERLERLAMTHERVGLGSSAEFAQVNTEKWWARIACALDRICVNGGPSTKLHGLRMLDSRLCARIPFSSADSTNVARNIGIDVRWKGTYLPVSKAARGTVLADRIEAAPAASMWAGL